MLRTLSYASTDAAEDLVQSAYERALSRRPDEAEVEKPKSWMRHIIHNLWIDQVRSSRSRLSEPLESDEYEAPDDTERAVIARTTLARVRAVVSDLPDDYRTVLMLVCVHGLSYKEAADKLGVPVGTIMSRLSRARMDLAQRIGMANRSR